MHSQLQAFRGDSRIEASESISVAVSQKLRDGEDAVQTTSGFCLKPVPGAQERICAESVWRKPKTLLVLASNRQLLLITKSISM